MQFANKSHLVFEPGNSVAFSVTSTGANRYTTPTGCRESLGDLARLQYVEGTLKYCVTYDAAESTGVLTVTLYNDTTELGSAQFTADGSTVYAGSFSVDLANVTGSDTLHVAVDVDTAGGAATTAHISAALSVEHPLVIG